MLKNILEIGPVIAFVTAYFLTKNTHENPFIIATYVLIAASMVQLALSWLLFKKIEKINLGVFALLLFFGGLTIFFQNETFLKWKPTVVSWLFALVLFVYQQFFNKNLIKKFLDMALRNVPEMTLRLPEHKWPRLNSYTILFFMLSGCLNLWVAFTFGDDTWVKFKLIGITIINFIGMISLFMYLSRYFVRSIPNQNAASNDE